MNIATTRTAHRPATPRRRSFLGKVLKGLKEWEQSEVLNTDAAPTYAAAIAELNAESKRPNEARHSQVKYLDNVVEADHGKLKLLIRPVRGFKTLKTAYVVSKSCARCARDRLGCSLSRKASSVRPEPLSGLSASGRAS